MKVEELPQEGFAECPCYITLMRFAFLTGLSDRPDLLYAWIESGDSADANLRYATPGGYAEAAKTHRGSKRADSTG
ncbi:hypothetical protein P4133_31890 [Pseudomonas aeruginosa]|nr:hypothetical protein [Pseudomonas aeruginosa]